MSATAKGPADYILPLYINGLEGRMLRMSSSGKSKREILLVYGHHGMLERWWGLVENLSDHGNVTMPDLPGFGGMESFYKIGVRPDIDAYADYLASFVKLRYNRKRVTIYAISYGFVVVTRMLQRYPELTKKVDILVSAVGFMHREDIVFRSFNKRLYAVIARFLATRPVSVLTRYLFLNGFVLRNLYMRLPSSKRKMLEITPEEFKKSIDFEVKLWRSNDIRTHWLTTAEFLNLDNCRQAVLLPVVHLVSGQDYYLNDTAVEGHMRQVFSGYTRITLRSTSHVPSVIGDKKAMTILIPPGLRKLLKTKV